MSSIPDRRAPDTGSLIDNLISPAMQRYFIHIIFVVIILVAAILIQIGMLKKIPTAFNFQGMPIQATPTANTGGALIAASASSTELVRQTDIHTNIPTRPRTGIITYTVQSGDSISGIAAKFNLTIETIVFSNPILDDDVHSLRPNQVLRIPPVNGLLRFVQKDDTLEKIAKAYKVDVDSVLNWPGNKFDLSLKPADRLVDKMAENTIIIVPGGTRGSLKREIQPIYKQSKFVITDAGPGQCPGGYSGGATGTGTFTWPVTTRWLSGTDYTALHLGVDLAAAMGQPVFAADSGVVTFAGWSNWGYGNMVMLDHGNGWTTLYSHFSQWNVSCGQSVNKGQIVGLAGSTGNSTGPHFHFEMNYQGSRPNPFSYLPAP